MPDESPTILRPPPALTALYSLPTLIVLVGVLSLVKQPTVVDSLFVVVALWVAWTAVPRGWSQVVLEGEQLTLRQPLHRPRTLQRRQVISGEMVGRWPWRVVLLRYHPMDERGRVDIANEEFLPLGPLQDADPVLEWLERKPGAAAETQAGGR